MQPWARHRVQGTLITGGMAAGRTGIASHRTMSAASAAQPARVPHARDDRSSFGDLGTTQPIFGCLSGFLDPPRERVCEPGLPGGIAGRHRSARRTPARMELAGWVIDVAQPGIRGHGGSRTTDGDVPFGTPSEGFHRSLSWTGAVGCDDRVPVDRGLVAPTDDPATVNGFDEPGSIMELWEGLLGSGVPEDLVTLDAVDLTVGSIPEPPFEVYTVPPELVKAALSTVFAPQPPPHEFIPLTVPGEFQQRVNEVSSLNLDLLTTQYGSYLDDKTVPLFATMADTGASKIVAALGGSPMSGPPPNPLTSTAPLTSLIRA